MNSLKKISALMFGLWACVTLSPAEFLPAYALVNCRIVPVTSPVIENGIIIIRGGLIESIGMVGKIKIPEDAEVIEAQGLTAYPGLISAHTNLFLEAPKERPGFDEEREPSRPAAEKAVQKPDLQAFKLIQPTRSTIDGYHHIGITTVLVSPEAGIFAGQCVLLNLNGEKPGAMVVKNPVALQVNFVSERNSYPSSLMGTVAFLRQSFLDAQHYSSYQSQFARIQRGMKRPEYDPFLEAIIPYVIEKKPLIITCSNQEDIKRALRLRAEFNLNVLLSGANEAWRVVDLLKKAQVPLLVSVDFRPPASSVYSQEGEQEKKKAEKDIYPANPQALAKAGLKFALTSLGLEDPAAVQKNIREAVKAGLPQEDALKALTITPAQFLGVDSILGSLEPGKIANIVMVTGEIFGDKTEVDKVFVDGQLFVMEKKPAEKETVKRPSDGEAANGGFGVGSIPKPGQ
jgi:imidazolonepropionase-like amidohydrolase